MQQTTNPVSQWRDLADEAHPSGPLFSAGLYAEADIALASTGLPPTKNCTGIPDCRNPDPGKVPK